MSACILSEGSRYLLWVWGCVCCYIVSREGLMALDHRRDVGLSSLGLLRGGVIRENMQYFCFQVSHVGTTPYDPIPTELHGTFIFRV